MGNNIGGRKKVKVMKINGETFKLKTPIQVFEVVKDYPGHVLLDSEAVKHFGIKAKPLEPQQVLKPKKVYFLVELPKFPEESKATRRVRSGINMSAKDRLECLMLSKRSVSDFSMVRRSSSGLESGGLGPDSGPVRLKMRLPKAQVAKLMEEGKDGVGMAEKLFDLCMKNGGEVVDRDEPEGGDDKVLLRRDGERKPGLRTIGETYKTQKKRVSFVPSDEEGEIRLDVGSR
ncbi:hypothetical protein FNV43_RR14942 [Rhamnella rubrinervis]|uniref:Plastid movement impaired 2 n=1 Tax=Rhamnella rubrinervis TaxID=2594499 RepID=A0A8K0H416_9ROSA|nr:hypothetical protein FNV43_RR14942 [Rhamnella rubrinervis]